MSRYPSLVSVALLVVCLLLLGPVGAAWASPGGDQQFEHSQQERLQQSQEWEPWANTSMHAEIQPEGDAEWRISTTIYLEDEQDVESFLALAADFEEGDEPAPGLELMQAAVDNVDSRTDRTMDITDIERGSTPSAEAEPDSYAKLYVEFTWENYARIGDDRLHVDDVLLTTEGNLWLPSLPEGQTFTMIGPEGYGVQATPGDDGTLEANQIRWEGPTTFEQSTLEATFIGSTPPPTNQTDDTDDDGDEGGFGLSLWWLIVPVLVLGLAAVVVAARMADLDFPDSDGSVDAEADDSDGADAAAAATADEPAATSTEPDDDVDATLLSDEERVERLLEQNGGRMKQATIVKETDWSDAKVSQLLSTMEDDGRIDKLRIGRENLISFPDEDVTEIDE